MICTPKVYAFGVHIKTVACRYLFGKSKLISGVSFDDRLGDLTL